MKLSYGNQEIDLFDKKIPKQVLLALSGGLDSASLFYLICNNFPEIEIIPYTGWDKTAPFDYLCAKDIIQFMKEKFPNQKILEHEFFEFDINNKEWRNLAEEKWEEEKVIINGKKVDRASSISGLTKILMKRHFENELRKKWNNALMITGMTCNPPIEEQRKNNFYELAERRRDTRNQIPWFNTIYQPYINIDKKFVANVYKKHKLMDTLYPLTSSCVGSEEETNYFSKPCGKCFWCKEKEWAFK